MKILFYTSNGVGLGHLRRASLIAEEIKQNNKGIKIALATMANQPMIFGKFFDQFIKLRPLSDQFFKNPAKFEKICLANKIKFVQSIKKFKPDLIIADFYLTSSFTFSIFKYGLNKFPVKSVLIWRLNERKKFYQDFNKEKDKLAYFNKIILPHNQEELKNLLGRPILNKINQDKRFKITGQILKGINREKITSCYKRYKISSKDFVLVVSFGGGGSLVKGNCDNSEKILKYFLNIYPKLIENIPNLKTVIITGPYFRRIKQGFPHLKMVIFEKNLPELFKVADLVVSTAGYNTCNELIQAKTPAVLIPLTRGDKEQFERADFLKRKGVVGVCKNISSRRLLNKILDCRNNLKKMESSFKNINRQEKGNCKVVKEILNLLKNN